MENIQLFTYGRNVPTLQWYINAVRWVNRIYYVYSGTATVRLGRGEEYRLLPGRLYLFSDRLSFDARQDAHDPMDHLYADFSGSPGLDLWEPMVFSVEEFPALRQAIAPLEALTADHRTGDTELAVAAVRLILQFLDRERPLPRLQDARVAKALQLLYSAPAGGITVRELAGRVHLEENYFIRLFQRIVGVSPYVYIRAQRLNLGISLLQNGATVAEAAQRTGYGDTAAFSKAMHRFTGRAPSALRAAVANEMTAR